jgi:hypothetical protein
MKDKNLKDQKSDSRNEITPLKTEDVKEGMKVRVVASVGIIKFIINTISEYGLAGEVVKGDDGKMYVQTGVSIIADVDDFMEHELMFEDKGYEKEETAADAD